MAQFSVCQLADFPSEYTHVFKKEEKSSLDGHPARSSGCSSFAKPVATSLDTSPQRRWPDCPPQVVSRPCRPSPPEQVHQHHVCEKSNTPLSSRRALRLSSVRLTSKHSQRCAALGPPHQHTIGHMSHNSLEHPAWDSSLLEDPLQRQAQFLICPRCCSSTQPFSIRFNS